VKLTPYLHLVPRSKNEWSYTSTPQYAFMAWFSVQKAQEQPNLYTLFATLADRSVCVLYSAVGVMNFISAVFTLLISLCFNVHISQPYENDAMAKILYTFNGYCLWTKFVFKTLFRISNIF
jgi:hypothetical protein